MDKPKDCIICLEELNCEYPLECGHWMHLECVQKHFKPECPLCRKVLNIKVEGEAPTPLDYIPREDPEDEKEYYNEFVVHFEIEENKNFYFYTTTAEISVDMIFEYEEECDCETEDEENTHGDNWNYEDV